MKKAMIFLFYFFMKISSTYVKALCKRVNDDGNYIGSGAKCDPQRIGMGARVRGI